MGGIEQTQDRVSSPVFSTSGQFSLAKIGSSSNVSADFTAFPALLSMQFSALSVLSDRGGWVCLDSLRAPAGKSNAYSNSIASIKVRLLPCRERQNIPCENAVDIAFARSD